LAGSTTKKVLLRRQDRQVIAGYASPQTYLRAEGVEILTREGQVLLTPYKELKAVYFVREFEAGAEEGNRQFHSRPKLDGLWVRMKFRDEEMLEGILPNDLLQIGEHGVTITPPEAYSNAQRIFVPRQALSEFKVLGVIGSPIHRERRKRLPAKEQIELFEPEPR
jgi:hypothetical protein